MKAFKKITIIALSVIMALAVLSGCNLTPEGDFTRVDPGVLPEKVEGRDYTPLKKYDETVTIKVMGSNAPREGSIAATYKGRPSGPKNQSFNDLALEHLNIKLDYISLDDPAQFETKLNLLISGNTLPDIIVTSNTTTYDTLRKGGMIQDIADVYHYLNDDLKEMFEIDYYKSGLQSCMQEGQLFAFPNVTNTYETAQRLYIRKDWLDIVGKSAPKTAEELLDVARAFRDNAAAIAAKSGLTAADIIPIGMHKDIQNEGSYGAQGFFEMFGAHIDAFLKDEKTGKIVSSNTTDEMKTALTLLNQMYSEKLIHTEFYNHSNSKVAADIISGKVGILTGQWWVPGYPLGDSVIYPTTPDADWIPVELPGYNGKSAVPVVSRLAVSDYRMVSKDCKNPEALARLVNLFFDIYYNDNALGIYGSGSTADGGLYHSWIPTKMWHSSASVIEYARVRDAFNELYDAGYRIDTAAILAAGFEDYDWESCYAAIEAHPTYGPIFRKMKTREKTIHFKQGYAYHQALKAGKAVKDMNKIEKGGFGIYEEMISPTSGYAYIDELTNGKKPVKYSEFYGVATPTQQEKGEYVNTYLKTYVMEVVTGKKDISKTWKTFVKEYDKNGGSAILGEVNEWYQTRPAI